MTTIRVYKVDPRSEEQEQRFMDLPITVDQYRAWKQGALIQDAMPNLDADQREFLISGLLPGEFEEMFPEEEE